LREDRIPIDLTGRELGHSSVSSIGTTQSRAHAKPALCEIEAVSSLAPNSVVRKPLQARGVDTSLQNQIFNEPPNRVIGERCNNCGAQAKASSQSAGHVVFSTAFEHPKTARCRNSHLSRIKTQHDFAEAHEIPGNASLRRDLQAIRNSIRIHPRTPFDNCGS
jgi:hypothetical protein